MKGSGRFLVRGSVSEFAWMGGMLLEISGHWVSQLRFEPANLSVHVRSVNLLSQCAQCYFKH
jgi:hypothetical protein